MRNWLRYLLVGLVLLTGLSACNTFRGAREDVRRGGQSVRNLFR